LGQSSRVLLFGGTAVAVLSLGNLHAALNDYDFASSPRLGWATVYIGALAISAYGVGLPDLVATRLAALGWGVAATTLGAGGISLFQIFVGDRLLPRFVVLLSPLLLIPWYAACAALSSTGKNRAQRRDRVFVVADLTEAKRLRDELADRPERPARLVDVMKIVDAKNGSGPQPLLEKVRHDRGSVLVLSRNAQLEDTIVSQAAAAHASGVRVRNLVSFYEEWLGKLPVSELERTSVMFDIREVHRRQYLRIKRVLDVAVAMVGLALLIILLPIVILGNLIANRGVLFYRQERVGKGSAIFEMIKFRTMSSNGVDHTTEWTSEHDPRITPFGRVLRMAHIDELPQVLNILRGDLSIVGPRPEQAHYVAWLVERMPFYDMRHWVSPGLTGWAQVKHGYAGTEQDALEKLQYDFYYLRHQSLSLDACIIARTLRSVIGLRGR
jgi:lipopolysaccharide/colanic/teichoic acid biosynthesis glycosyltransferase